MMKIQDCVVVTLEISGVLLNEFPEDLIKAVDFG